MKTIGIIGQGFTGSAMSVICSRAKKNNKILYKVIGFEKDNTKGNKIIKSLNQGDFPFKNEDELLKKELKKTIKQKNFFATNNLEHVKDCDIIIVSINLDISSNKTREKDLKNFKNLISFLGSKIKKKKLILIESTVPPGFSDKIIKPILIKIFKSRGYHEKDLYLAHSYERVTPGENYLNSIKNSYRVFSAGSAIEKKICRSFLNSIINVKKYPLTELANSVSSELSKILENSYRAINIAFIDEWTKFAEKLNINLFEVIEAIKKRKTHKNLMYPGLGVGGYCITKDPYYGKYSAECIHKFKDTNFPLSLMARKINNKMPNHSMFVLKKNINKLKSKKILLAGITYKNDVADTRNSPSELVYDFLIKQKCKITCYDPLIDYWEEKKINIETKISNFKNFDVIIFAVPHKDFKSIKISHFSKKNFILDTNRCLDKKLINNLFSKKIKIKLIGDKNLI
jgi:UDP-N-acetyl-D-glucosamine dehydrogenase